jgi:hypothetical protein
MSQTEAERRKSLPLWSGLMNYFPDAILAVAELSRIGNEQHNPGQPLHWAREKSTDQEDCCARHLLRRGTRDTDGVRHSQKLAWRSLALLQLELEAEGATPYEALSNPYKEELVRRRSLVRIGAWYTYCCHLDLEMISTQEDVESLLISLDDVDDPPHPEIWPSEEAALEDMLKRWDSAGEEYRKIQQRLQEISETNCSDEDGA